MLIPYGGIRAIHLRRGFHSGRAVTAPGLRATAVPGWQRGSFHYNAAVVNVNRTVFHNTYVNRTVVTTTVVNRVRYHGPSGVMARPAPRQAALRQPCSGHIGADVTSAERCPKPQVISICERGGGATYRHGNKCGERPTV